MATALTYYTELQEPTVNGDVDLWGAILNSTNAAWDRALAGLATASLAGANWTPTTSEGECLVLKPTGVLVANQTITVPAKKRRYVVWNVCSGAFSVTITAGGVGVVCAQGVLTFVYCDGTDIYNIGSGGTSLTLTSTDAGAAAAPIVTLYRDSATPAASDLIGQLLLSGEDSAGNTETYGTITGKIIDPTSTSEDAELIFATVIAGALANRVHVGAGMYTSGAASGDMGANTFNATALYEAGVALTATYARLAVANVFTATQTISSTDAGAAVGPTFDLYRDSASPAANDVIGSVDFNGRDSGATKTLYGRVNAVIVDPTDGSEDSRINFSTLVAGTLAARFYVRQGAVVGSVVTDQGDGTLNATTLYQNNVALASAAFVATGTSGATIPLLNGNNVYSGTAEFTGGFTVTGSSIASNFTDAGAGGGPDLTQTRISATPAANDILGRWLVQGRDSGANTTVYGLQSVEIIDPTDTSEDGRWGFATVIAGTLLARAYIGAGLYMANSLADMGVGTGNFTALYANGARIVPTIQRFTASDTWNRPTGCIRAFIRGVGAGGGGGGADSDGAGSDTAGGGGGAGEYFEKLLDVSAISSLTITIGAAGTAGAATGGNGGTGGTTTVTGQCSGVGGTGGTGTGSAAAAGTYAVGGAGGTGGTAGDLNVAGQTGDAGIAVGNVDLAHGGRGGSPYRFGQGGQHRAAGPNTGNAGQVGIGFGAGGSGATSIATSGNLGAVGTAGYVEIWEYYG